MSPRFRQDSFKLLGWKRKWLVRASLALGMTAAGQALVLAVPPSGIQAASDIYYTQSDFTLPFQVKPGGRCPQSLDLLVSRDGGRTWNVHQTAAPAEGRFQFSQATEGEYWLKVQVRDKVGSALTNSTMHLCVDRTRPQASLQCDWQGDSKLMVSSTIQDVCLDLQSLKLSLRTDVENTPKLIALQAIPLSRDVIECQAAIEMPSCKSFELRLIAKDRAGNCLTIGERFFHPVLADENDALLPATVEPEKAPVVRKPELEIAQSDWTPVELGTPKPLTNAQLVSSGAGQSVVRNRDNRSQDIRNLENRISARPQELIPPERPSQLVLDAPAAPESRRSVANVVASSRKFQIHYNLNESVPAEQLNVELWVTNDAGATWEFWGLDRDAQSPASVEVDRDGEFGFCVVCVHSEADLKFRPQAGDPPDLNVTVKQSTSRRRLQPAAQD